MTHFTHSIPKQLSSPLSSNCPHMGLRCLSNSKPGSSLLILAAAWFKIKEKKPTATQKIHNDNFPVTFTCRFLATEYVFQPDSSRIWLPTSNLWDHRHQNFGALLALWNEQVSEYWQSRALLLIPQSGLTAELSGLTQREIAECVGFKSMPWVRHQTLC